MEREAKEALILRLFRAYPGGANSVSRETVNIYLRAVEFFAVELIAEAVDRFAMGMVDRKGRSFVPSADELATEIRNVRFQQGATNRLISQGLKQIEAREKDDAEIERARTPEAMQRVRELMEGVKLSVNPDTRTAEEVAEAKERLRKTDALFSQAMIETESGIPVSRSLMAQLDKGGMDGEAQ